MKYIKNIKDFFQFISDFWNFYIILFITGILFCLFRECDAQVYLHPTTGMANEYIGSCVTMTCAGTYYDDGGAGGNYANNINWIYRTFCPNISGMCMRATFSQFVVECANPPCNLCYDILRAENGPTQNSPTIWQLCSTGALPPVTTSTDASGCLTFRFLSDASVRRAGWTAALSCVPCAANTVVDNNDCIDATAICSNTSFVGASVGPGILGEGCSGCNTSEHFTNWYRFCVSTSGVLQFNIIPSNAGEDYDFALYGSNVLCSSLGIPIRCSYAGVTGNTGLLGGSGDNSEDVLGNGWVETINVVVGECYYLMISQWSAGGSGFTVDFTGSSASLDCTVLPLELLDFYCKENQKNNILYWTTLSEINVDKFLIEGSEDLTKWTFLTEIKALGTNNIEEYSSIVDKFHYFRLSEIDFNGKIVNLRVISCNNSYYQLDEIIEVYNVFGQIIFRGVRSGFKGELIASGMYFIVNRMKNSKIQVLVK